MPVALSSANKSSTVQNYTQNQYHLLLLLNSQHGLNMPDSTLAECQSLVSQHFTIFPGKSYAGITLNSYINAKVTAWHHRSY